MSKKYTIGLDFGSESGRAVLLDLATGEPAAQAVCPYAHGVITRQLPDGTVLPPDWALQDPADYLDVLKTAIPAVVQKSGVEAADIIGIGVDFTACTLIPVDAVGTPLCQKPEYAGVPHAWPKLWKHHAAQAQASRITELAQRRQEPFLPRYGGKVSSEWLFPKVLQILEEAPEIYKATDRFLEAADYLVLQLTGKEARNNCCAGCKALWSKADGYPSKAFLSALDPRLRDLPEEKLSYDIYPVGTRVGSLTPEAAAMTGLKAGTAVSAGCADAYAAIPAVGITEPGQLLMIMGTSTCHLLLGRSYDPIPGICGVTEGLFYPDLNLYEAGQSCVGDHFAWCVRSCVPPDYFAEAERRGINIYSLLAEKAAALRPGESGLLALDWWNGNRSVLENGDLTGMILGMTLSTTAPEIYRALVEATAFGTRAILDNFTDHGIPVRELYACGGIARKDPFFMQVYADVTGRQIRIAKSDQAPAVGAAIFGAVAAGTQCGGFATISEAAKKLGKTDDVCYTPIPENQKVYDALYREYKTLHDYFGRGENTVMSRLKQLRKQVK